MDFGDPKLGKLTHFSKTKDSEWHKVEIKKKKCQGRIDCTINLQYIYIYRQ